ncbi:unnamed protein product [Trichogramma brassicae]|uniref:Isovaleryl-CoA dehydrogenase, mitochondrial n=1 Tax=Trichogramma brassicae TaxID=86971 RepID=A0A6H5J4R8_9HYME|nr:unnamed protein product [Trichogramma brassicae]
MFSTLRNPNPQLFFTYNPGNRVKIEGKGVFRLYLAICARYEKVDYTNRFLVKFYIDMHYNVCKLRVGILGHQPVHFPELQSEPPGKSSIQMNPQVLDLIHLRYTGAFKCIERLSFILKIRGDSPTKPRGCFKRELREQVQNPRGLKKNNVDQMKIRGDSPVNPRGCFERELHVQVQNPRRLKKNNVDQMKIRGDSPVNPRGCFERELREQVQNPRGFKKNQHGSVENPWFGRKMLFLNFCCDLRTLVMNFAQRELAPKAAEIDRKNDFDELRGFWRQLGKLGLLGMTVRPEYGGSGAGYLDHVLAMEELSRASGAIGLSYGAHSNLCVNQIHRHGSEEQKRRYLPKLCSGEHVGGLAMSESGAGSDVVSMRLKAERRGDSYLLNGTKFWITNAPDADLLVVYARTDPLAAKKQHGITAFLLERASSPGLRVAQKLDKLGMRGSNTGELVFEDCLVPGTYYIYSFATRNCIMYLVSYTDSLQRARPGEQGHIRAVQWLGPREARFGRWTARVSQVSLLNSLIANAQTTFYQSDTSPNRIMQACCDVAFEYAHQRKQFGRSIADFQMIQTKIADMYTRLSASRSYLYSVARACDNGRVNSKDCAAVILYAAEKATKCALEAIQILGGNGFINDYPTGRLLRDAKLYEIGAGTSEIRRMIIARAIANQYSSKSPNDA